MDGEATNQPTAVDANVDPALAGTTVNELGEPIVEEKKEVIPEETLQDMQNLWNVFDMKKTDRVDISKLKTILKALDFNLDP